MLQGLHLASDKSFDNGPLLKTLSAYLLNHAGGFMEAT